LKILIAVSRSERACRFAYMPVMRQTVSMMRFSILASMEVGGSPVVRS
jgi:hypothetical protein